MITSFSKNFIFVRTRKTASTSTEIVLGAVCGPGDVVTPVGVDDELIRLNYGGEPRNFCVDAELENRYRRALKSADRTAIAAAYKQVMAALNFHHHMSAVDIRSKVPGAFWSQAVKFAVDRNPYEKVVSLTYWRKRKENLAGKEFEAAVDEIIDGGEYKNFGLYSEDGVPVVDFVLRYETLWSDLDRLAARLGFSLAQMKPRAKSQYRKDARPASDILLARQKRRIQTVCAEEFALLGYDP